MPSVRVMDRKESQTLRWMMPRVKAMTGNTAPVAASAMAIWLHVIMMIVPMNGFIGAV